MNFNKYIKCLPDTYQEVDYIQSNGGGEYLDINYIPSKNTNLEIDFEFIGSTHPTLSSIPLLGERLIQLGFSIISKFGFWVNKDTYREELNFGSYDSGYDSSAITNANIWNVISNNKANLYYNGIFVCGDSSATFMQNDLSIYVFALNENGKAISRNLIAKIYGLKLYENNTLVRNLVPCYRKSDNLVGLFDTVDNVFFFNQGSGSISVGADVNLWYSIPHYLHNNIN